MPITSLPSDSRLPRECEILNTSQSCRPLQPVMGVALLTLKPVANIAAAVV
jgi:hypothetical protein